jgi:hypothetical protein
MFRLGRSTPQGAEGGVHTYRCTSNGAPFVGEQKTRSVSPWKSLVDVAIDATT